MNDSKAADAVVGLEEGDEGDEEEPPSDTGPPEQAAAAGTKGGKGFEQQEGDGQQAAVKQRNTKFDRLVSSVFRDADGSSVLAKGPGSRAGTGGGSARWQQKLSGSYLRRAVSARFVGQAGKAAEGGGKQGGSPGKAAVLKGGKSGGCSHLALSPTYIAQRPIGRWVLRPRLFTCVPLPSTQSGQHTASPPLIAPHYLWCLAVPLLPPCLCGCRPPDSDRRPSSGQRPPHLLAHTVCSTMPAVLRPPAACRPPDSDRGSGSWERALVDLFPLRHSHGPASGVSHCRQVVDWLAGSLAGSLLVVVLVAAGVADRVRHQTAAIGS